MVSQGKIEMSPGRIHRKIVRTSFHRPGRLVPPTARRMRARSVLLKPQQTMPWHSTGPREELLIVWAGTIRVETQPDATRLSGVTVRAGGCVFVPPQTVHQVVNRSPRPAQYVYVTA